MVTPTLQIDNELVFRTPNDVLQSALSDSILFLEKASVGRSSIADISDALKEYKRLFSVKLASPAEILTLHRAFPENEKYSQAAKGLDDDNSPVVVGGPASIEMVDREGHLITTDALTKAFDKYMDNFRTRNTMVMHSDVQVGWALPAYITKGGSVFRSGVDPKGLFFVTELRNDTKIAAKVKDQIENGKMRSYSIAGNATQTKDLNKEDGTHVMQVDDLELAEVTICEKGVNQGAHFDLMKGMEIDVPTKEYQPQESFYIAKEDMPSLLSLFQSYMGKEFKLDEAHENSRRSQLRCILDEFGFPQEAPNPEFNRYAPVKHKLPWESLSSRVVNESGQDLGEDNAEQSPDISKIKNIVKSLGAGAPDLRGNEGGEGYSPVKPRKTKPTEKVIKDETQDIGREAVDALFGQKKPKDDAPPAPGTSTSTTSTPKAGAAATPGSTTQRGTTPSPISDPSKTQRGATRSPLAKMENLMQIVKENAELKKFSPTVENLLKIIKGEEDISVDGKDGALVLPMKLADQLIAGRPKPASVSSDDRLMGAMVVLKKEDKPKLNLKRLEGLASTYGDDAAARDKKAGVAPRKDPLPKQLKLPLDKSRGSRV